MQSPKNPPFETPKTTRFDQFAWVLLGAFLGTILGNILGGIIGIYLPSTLQQWLILHLVNGGNPPDDNWADGVIFFIYSILIGGFVGCLLGMAWPLKRIYRPRRAKTTTSGAS